MGFKILAINPGSTSTKIALYEEEVKLVSKTIDHPLKYLSTFKNINDQLSMRKEAVMKFINESEINIDDIDVVVGRGGLLPPVKSGAYLVNDQMINRLLNNPILEHASNLGAIISYEISKKLGIDSYIYDSVSVDELIDIARVSGNIYIQRSCLSHTLNSRSMAIKYCKANNKLYNDQNIIVAHLGGGITISMHNKGRIIDIVSDDEGPFSPERSGKLPCKKIIDMCFSGKFTYNEMLSMIRGNAGLLSYLGTVDVREVEYMIENGDNNAKLIFESMIYQISKGIGELATTVHGEVDAIVITGGIAHSKNISKGIKDRVQFIGEVEILPGENELESLAYGVLRVLKKEEEYNIYTE